MRFRFIFFAVIILFVSSFSFAQSLQKVSGKITDSESGSPIVGASIVVSASGKGVNSDVEGGFFLSLEKGKKYTITITSVGYNQKQLTDFEITDTDVPSLNVSLDRAAKQLEGAIVRTTAKKAAQASIYAAQKNSSSISDGISAEIIRKSPDKNTGEVLKRVSGASVQDNKFVIIRGLSERYNVSMLNNSVLPSTEADKKAFAFDIIPSSVVDNLVIYKSATPDLPGDFSGGAIKVLTKDYPAKSLGELSVSISYNSLTTGKNFYKSYPDGSLDAVGFFDNSRLMPGPYYRNKSSFISKSDEFKTAVTKLFPNTYGYTPANQSLPSISVSYTGGNTALLSKGHKLGYIYSIGYGNGRSVSERERDEFDITRQQRYAYNTSNYDEKNNLSALLNLTYSYGKSKISLKNLFNNNFVKTTGIRNGANYENSTTDPFYIKSSNSEASGTGLINSVLEGVHKLGNTWNVDWNGSFGYTYKNQPDQRILSFRSPDGVNGNYYLKLNNQNSPEISNAGRVYSFLGEYIYGVSANVTKQFNWLGQAQKLKIGTMNYYRNRTVEVDALGYSSLGFTGVQINETKQTTYNTIFSPANIDQYKLTVANIGTASTDYDANALLNAGYVMLDNKFSDKIKLTWGARIEKYKQELTAKGKNKKTYDNTDILPSLLLTYSLNNKTNIRLAGSEAVNRPEFRELADYRVYDYDNNYIIIGNPNLERSKNTNADLRYELFPAAGEIISASVFYKYFDKPIEQTNQGNDILSYQNADHATVYGAEIEIRKKLDFFGGNFFDRVTFYTNAAYIKGKVQFNGVTINSPMQGQSPYLINGGLTYAAPSDAFSVNVLYNRIGPRLRFRSQIGGALNIFEKPRDVVDFQVSKKILKNKMELKLTVSDILANPFTWYYKYDANASNINYKGSEDKIITSNKFGTTAALSLRYNFGR
jgi:TonB-dependent receptor